MLANFGAISGNFEATSGAIFGATLGATSGATLGTNLGGNLKFNLGGAVLGATSCVSSHCKINMYAYFCVIFLMLLILYFCQKLGATSGQPQGNLRATSGQPWGILGATLGGKGQPRGNLRGQGSTSREIFPSQIKPNSKTFCSREQSE